MTIDIKKIKARKVALDSRGGNSSFWRPQEGDQTIRIVPTEDGDPFKDFFFHYNVGKNSGFVCPKKNFGDDCPVCGFATKLYNEGTDDSIKMAKSLFARQRFFSPVVVRGEEADGVRIWGYGKMAYESLLNLVLNPEYGDITDAEEGTDLILTYGKPPGAQFPQTKLQPRRQSSPLCQEGPEKCAEMMESIPEFEGLFERKTTEQVGAMLDEFLSDEDSAEDSSVETSKYNKKEASSVDEAFSELLS